MYHQQSIPMTAPGEFVYCPAHYERHDERHGIPEPFRFPGRSLPALYTPGNDHYTRLEDRVKVQ